MRGERNLWQGWYTGSAGGGGGGVLVWWGLAGKRWQGAGVHTTMWEEDRQQDKNCGFALCHQVTTRDGEDEDDVAATNCEIGL